MTYEVKTRTVMRVRERVLAHISGNSAIMEEHAMHVAELFAGEGELVCSAEGSSEVEALRYLDWAVERMHSEQSTAVAKARRGR